MLQAPFAHDPCGSSWQSPLQNLSRRNFDKRLVPLLFDVYMGRIMVVMVHTYVNAEKIGDNRQFDPLIRASTFLAMLVDENQVVNKNVSSKPLDPPKNEDDSVPPCSAFEPPRTCHTRPQYNCRASPFPFKNDCPIFLASAWRRSSGPIAVMCCVNLDLPPI